MESEAAKRLCAAVRGLGRKRRNEPVPSALRRQLVRYARARRRAGGGWWTIGRELGVGGTTLQRWCAPAVRAGMRPVRVASVARRGRQAVAERTDRVVVVTATGHRVEGLGVGEAVLLLRALGG